MKSKQRQTMEAVQALTGQSLVAIYAQAHELMNMGLTPDIQGAVEYLLTMAEEAPLYE